MPRFHFILRACGTIHHDKDGTECADLAAARAHAADVARELMRNAETGTRLWSMRVEDASGQAVFELLFADIPALADVLAPEVRHLRHLTCRRQAELIETMCAVRATIAESRMLRARMTQKPQLAFARAG